MHIFVVLMLFVSICSSCPAAQLKRSETLSCDGDDLHAPSLLQTHDGTLLMAFSGNQVGSNEHPQSSSLLLTRKNLIKKYYEPEPSWKAWDASLKILITVTGSSIWNPVLTQTSNNKILLFFRLGKNPRFVRGYVMTSEDNGITWSNSQALPAGIYGPTKNRPLLLTDGSLLCGSSIEAGEPESPDASTSCWIEVASPDLTEWKKYGPFIIPNQPFGCIEPALTFDEEGKLLMLCRNRAAKRNLKGFAWSATSTDFGKTWTPFTQTEIPNPDSPLDIIKLKDGRLLMALNPEHKGRSRLSLFTHEEGNWTLVTDIEKIEEAEISFPSIVQSKHDSLLHIVYSGRKDNISNRVIRYSCLGLTDDMSDDMNEAND
jgi:predicted neuraminidase